VDIHTVDMNPMPPRVIGKEAYLWAKVFQAYQKTLDPRSIQTFESERSQKKQGNL
jgi:hypothetical protein